MWFNQKKKKLPSTSKVSGVAQSGKKWMGRRKASTSMPAAAQPRPSSPRPAPSSTPGPSSASASSASSCGGWSSGLCSKLMLTPEKFSPLVDFDWGVFALSGESDHFWREHPPHNGTGCFILGQHVRAAVLGVASICQGAMPGTRFWVWLD